MKEKFHRISPPLEISQNLQENIYARVSFLIKLQASGCNFIKKETLSQMFSCEFREISKKTFFIEHLWATASQKNVNRTNITPTLRNVSILQTKVNAKTKNG